MAQQNTTETNPTPAAPPGPSVAWISASAQKPAAPSTIAKLRKAYDDLAADCAATALAIEKRRPELEKKIQEELLKLGLNLEDKIKQKRAAWTAWEKARDEAKARAAQSSTPQSPTAGVAA